MVTEVSLENELDAFDTYMYLFFGPIGIFLSMVLLVIHICFKDLRKQPGDLIVMISLSELLLCAHWTMSASKTTYVSSSYTEDSTFCKINMYMASISAAMDTCYNVCFLLYVVFAIKNSIKTIFMPKYTFHLFAITVSTIMVFLKHQKLGRNAYGTCSVVLDGKDLIEGGIVFLLIIILCITVYRFASKSLSLAGPKQSKLKREFLSYYGGYIKTYLTMTILATLSFVSQYFSIKGQDGDEEGLAHERSHSYIFSLGRTANAFKLLTPICMFFIRIKDPLIEKAMNKSYRNITKFVLLSNQMKLNKIKVKKAKSDLEESMLKENSETDISLGKLDMENHMSGRKTTAFSKFDREALENEMMTSEPDDLLWMNLLPSKLKEAMTRTFMGSIATIYSQVLKELSDLSPEDCLNLDNKSNMRQFQIQGDKLALELDTKDSLLNNTFTIYNAPFFAQIIRGSSIEIDFYQSLSLMLNDESIRKTGKGNGKGNGGASGELFLFSFDNKLILKTITESDYMVFSNILHKYATHLHTHPESLIARIFGLFSFQIEDTGKKVYLMVQENLIGLFGNAVLRKYDLKGSSYSRQVLDNYDGLKKTSEVSDVLKDIDFINIDGVIELENPEIAIQVAKILQKDSLFFKYHKIIDYSMFLVVLDISELPTGTVNNELNRVDSHMRLIKPVGDSKQALLIGVIDYFQLYTFQKMLERFSKRLLKCNASLDTSSQPPKFYSERFLEAVKSMLKVEVDLSSQSQKRTSIKEI